LAFINALIFQGCPIYKLLGNHEVMNIVNPDPTYLFQQDKMSAYTKINDQPEYRVNIFRLNQVGYNAIFYRKCYALLQIDNNIFVHGQLVGENYSYYEVLNNVLNYDVMIDIKKNFGKSGLIRRLIKAWHEFIILIAYKGIYIKNITKWSALYHHLKTNVDNIYPMVVKDVDELVAHNLDNVLFQQRSDVLKEYLVTLETNIKFINTTLFEKKLNKLELILTLKPEFDKMKQFVFSSYLNTEENELWKRQYGFTTSTDNNNFCHMVDDDLEAYNKHNTGTLAERIIVGHCTQHLYTHSFRINTSYNTVKQEGNELVERLIPPSVTGSSYYNTKNDNLIFGITMDCPCNKRKNFHKLYKVDVGTSRGFDVFSNYKNLFDEIEYLNFFEVGFSGSSFGLILDDNLPFTSQISIEDDLPFASPNENAQSFPDDDSTMDYVSVTESDGAEASTIELTKRNLIREFLKEFISRIPQVLEINNGETSIVRATLKNIYMYQKRRVLNELAKNHHLIQVIMNGGYDLSDCSSYEL
jgi:hypothetical protein